MVTCLELRHHYKISPFPFVSDTTHFWRKRKGDHHMFGLLSIPPIGNCKKCDYLVLKRLRESKSLDEVVLWRPNQCIFRPVTVSFKCFPAMFKQNLDLSAFGKQIYIALQLRTLASCKFQAKSKLSNFACYWFRKISNMFLSKIGRPFSQSFCAPNFMDKRIKSIFV